MRFDPDWRVAPGENLKEMLDDRGLTVDDLAAALDVSTPVAAALLEGTEPLTRRKAERLEALLGVTFQFWLNLEAEYRRPRR